jgi:pilus assembly protein Flp/PilA
MNFLKRLLREQDGQDMIEYALLAAFISIVAIVTLQAIGPLVSTVYTNIQNALPT